MEAFKSTGTILRNRGHSALLQLTFDLFSIPLIDNPRKASDLSAQRSTVSSTSTGGTTARGRRSSGIEFSGSRGFENDGSPFADIHHRLFAVVAAKFPA